MTSFVSFFVNYFVGERTREGNDLYHEMIEGGVIKVDKDGKPIDGSKAALVYGQMNEPPGITLYHTVRFYCCVFKNIYTYIYKQEQEPVLR